MKSSDWQKLGLEPLPSRTLEIMSLIARGFSYDDIVNYRPQLTYSDIRSAAEQVIELSERIASIQADILRDQKQKGIEAIKASYPRAYTPWTDEDINTLIVLHKQAVSVTKIAQRLERQETAVISKLFKMGLINEDTYRTFKPYVRTIDQGKKQ